MGASQVWSIDKEKAWLYLTCLRRRKQGKPVRAFLQSYCDGLNRRVSSFEGALHPFTAWDREQLRRVAVDIYVEVSS